MFKSLFVCAALLAVGNAGVLKQVLDFEAKPNGQDQTVSLVLPYPTGDITCTFTYACQGGTGEDWNMLIELDEEGVAQCFVGRAGASYLYFSHFRVQVDPDIQIMHAEVESPNGPLKHEEYEMVGGAIHSSDKFTNAVSRITAGWMPGEAGSHVDL